MSDIQNRHETDDMSLKYTNILRANGITDPISEVLVNDAGLQGEGFASKTQCITVKFQDPVVKPLNLFAKVVSQCESHTEMLDSMKAFEKEARFLTEYVPAAERLWKAKGCEGTLDLYPKCYYGDKRIILMENLVLEQGYCLLSKVDRQDMETAKFALTTLAKHHAVSYAMIQEEGGPDKFFAKFPHLDFEAFDKPLINDMMGPMFGNCLNFNIGILENNNVGGREEALAFLKTKKAVDGMTTIVANLKCEEGDLLVLNHGDYWNNNMMFLKDKRTDKVIGHKAIDLQITRYNTPTLDLVYYFQTSVQTNVRMAHLKELLEFYLGVLRQVTKDLGYPINLTFEQFFLQFRKRLDFGFWFAMCTVVGPAMAAMKDFDINSVDIKDWAASWDGIMRKWMAANPEYTKGIAEELVKLAQEFQSLAVKTEGQ